MGRPKKRINTDQQTDGVGEVVEVPSTGTNKRQKKKEKKTAGSSTKEATVVREVKSRVTQASVRAPQWQVRILQKLRKMLHFIFVSGHL